MRRIGRIAAAAVLMTAAVISAQVGVAGPRTSERVYPTLAAPATTDPVPEPDATTATAPAPAPAPRTTASSLPASSALSSTAARSSSTARSSTGSRRPVAVRSSTGSNLPVAAGSATVQPSAVASVETDLLPGGSGDVADDSAVWRNAARPDRSLVVSDNKAVQGGVAVHDLRGKLVSYRPGGEIGNIDLRSDVRLGKRSVILVGANDRSTSRMRFWTLDPARGTLSPVEARALPTVAPNYGFCLGRSANRAHLYAFVSGEESGSFEQYELLLGSGRVDARKVRTIVLGTLSEGCVVDDVRDTLYIAEEDVGIWRYGLAPGSRAARTAVDRVGSGRLTADVEGLAVARGKRGGVLIVSSQGDSSYSVYDLDGRRAFRGRFRVGGSAAVDGATNTDGLAVAAGDFGPAFPGGLLVVHDAQNEGPNGTEEPCSNLKFVRLDQVVALSG